MNSLTKTLGILTLGATFVGTSFAGPGAAYAGFQTTTNAPTIVKADKARCANMLVHQKSATLKGASVTAVACNAATKPTAACRAACERAAL